jgi:para-nitrobenzyl esterase
MILRSIGILSAAASLLACAHPGVLGATPLAAPGLVTMESGVLQGEIGAGFERFRAVPYAAAPVGPLRWRRPQPAARWDGVRDATQPGAGCLQSPGATAAPRLSEDCLFLEVTRPAGVDRGERLPVMVWIHGGGFSTGAGSDYDARRLAIEGRVVVVAVNYRLGSMGFYSHPNLEDSGLFGLLDQQEALRWVRRNAAAFGGNPANVTVFGESAGAMSICAQLVAPGAKGLFDKAILQSGTCLQRWAKSMIWPGAEGFDQFPALTETAAAGAAAAKTMGCGQPDAITCLRGLSAEVVMKSAGGARPAYGGAALPERPATALVEGRFHRVPLIWGSTRDEWRASAGIFDKTTPFTAGLYRKFLTEGFADRAKEVEARYPGSELGGAVYAWAAVSTDSAWSCPTLESVRAAGRHAPVYFYQFDDREAPNPAFPVAPDFKLGAAHATELAYLFDLPAGPTLTREQRTLASGMIGYWSSFARDGRPSAAGLPTWPAVTGSLETRALSLKPVPDSILIVDVEERHHCAFWRDVAPAVR